MTLELPASLQKELDDARKSYNQVQARVLEFKYENLSEAPKCPEGCGSVLRQKCMWDQGPGCPRNEVIEEWGDRTRLSHHMALIEDGFSPKAAVLAYSMLKGQWFEIEYAGGRKNKVGLIGLTDKELVKQARKAAREITL